MIDKAFYFWIMHFQELEILFFLNFILFLNLKRCIRFAKHQNESATGIHVLPIRELAMFQVRNAS